MTVEKLENMSFGTKLFGDSLLNLTKHNNYGSNEIYTKLTSYKIDNDKQRKVVSKGYYPYFAEVVDPNQLGAAIRNILAGSFSPDDADSEYLQIGNTLISRLQGYRYKYPLMIDNDTIICPREDLDINGVLYENRDMLNILKRLWQDRQEKYDDYLNLTYTGDTSGTNDSTGESHTISDGTTSDKGTNQSKTIGHGTADNVSDSNTDTTGHNEGKSTSDGTTSSVSDGTSKTINSSTTDGTTTGDTTGTSNTTGDTTKTGTTNTTNNSTTKGITGNSSFPEANLGGNSGGVIQPGAIDYSYLSNSSENNGNSTSDTKVTDNSDTKQTSDTKTSGTNKGSSHAQTDGTSNTTTTNTANGTSSNKTSNSEDSTGNSKTKSTSNTTNDNTTDVNGSTTNDGTSHSKVDNNTVGNIKSTGKQSGRNKDLINLSEAFQDLVESKETFINEIVELLKPCFKRFVSSFNVNMFYIDNNTYDGFDINNINNDDSITDDFW